MLPRAARDGARPLTTHPGEGSGHSHPPEPPEAVQTLNRKPSPSVAGVTHPPCLTRCHAHTSCSFHSAAAIAAIRALHCTIPAELPVRVSQVELCGASGVVFTVHLQSVWLFLQVVSGDQFLHTTLESQQSVCQELRLSKFGFSGPSARRPLKNGRFNTRHLDDVMICMSFPPVDPITQKCMRDLGIFFVVGHVDNGARESQPSMTSLLMPCGSRWSVVKRESRCSRRCLRTQAA